MCPCEKPPCSRLLLIPAPAKSTPHPRPQSHAPRKGRHRWDQPESAQPTAWVVQSPGRAGSAALPGRVPVRKVVRACAVGGWRPPRWRPLPMDLGPQSRSLRVRPAGWGPHSGASLFGAPGPLGGQSISPFSPHPLTRGSEPEGGLCTQLNSEPTSTYLQYDRDSEEIVIFENHGFLRIGFRFSALGTLAIAFPCRGSHSPSHHSGQHHPPSGRRQEPHLISARGRLYPGSPGPSVASACPLGLLWGVLGSPSDLLLHIAPMLTELAPWCAGSWERDRARAVSRRRPCP